MAASIFFLRWRSENLRVTRRVKVSIWALRFVPNRYRARNANNSLLGKENESKPREARKTAQLFGSLRLRTSRYNEARYLSNGGTMQDEIPLEDEVKYVAGGGASGPHACMFYAFNTEISLSAYGCESAVAFEAFERAVEACRCYERLFSRTLPHSDVSRLNAAGGAEVTIADETYDLLRGSLYYCEQSLGWFDITVGSLTSLWDFQRGVMPDADALQGRLALVDWRGIELGGEPGTRTARLSHPGAMVDVGGTAKGWIADRLGEFLRVQGVGHFIINLGGNVVVGGGKPDGSPFSVGIRNPKDTSKILGAISLTDGSVVTSGLYERCFELDGKRYCHILDPRTGMPIQTDVESATVVAAKSFDCDGFSTTLCALGIERGIEFAKSRSEIAVAIFVDSQNRLHYSTR